MRDGDVQQCMQGVLQVQHIEGVLSQKASREMQNRCIKAHHHLHIHPQPPRPRSLSPRQLGRHSTHSIPPHNSKSRARTGIRNNHRRNPINELPILPPIPTQHDVGSRDCEPGNSSNSWRALQQRWVCGAAEIRREWFLRWAWGTAHFFLLHGFHEEQFLWIYLESVSVCVCVCFRWSVCVWMCVDPFFLFSL